MKPSASLRLVRAGSLAALLAALLGTQSTQATTLYWDLNQSTDNAAGAITGAWDGTNIFWNTDSSGSGGTPQPGTTNADDLVFSSGSLYTTGTVTIGHAPAASSITFEDNIAVTLAGSVPQNAASVTAENGADTFTYTGTVVQDGQIVTFGGTPPTGLIAGQVYYVRNATPTTYQVSSTPGGAVIDFTDDGTAVTNTVKAALILGGTGTKSGIFVLAGNNAANVVSAPIILNAASTIQNGGDAGLTISGGITGTADLTLKAEPAPRPSTSNTSAGGGSNGITISTGAVNISGKIINAGTGVGRVAISSAVGSSVTEIRQDSNTSQLQLTGGITVNTGGTTLSCNGIQSMFVHTGAIGGTGNLILQNNSLYTSAMGSKGTTSFVPNGITILADVNNVGTIINSGTGSAFAQIGGVIGTNVTGVTQNSSGSNLMLFGVNTYNATTTINAGILGAGNAAALGNTAGSISFGGGTLQYVGITTDFSSRFAATGDNAYSIDTNGQSVTFATGLAASGASGLTKLGAGTLTLTGTNLFTGTTVIGGGTGSLQKLTGGTLRVGDGTNGSLNGTAGTALTFKGTGTLNVNEAAGVDQGMGALTFTAGAATVQSTYAGTSGVDTSVLSFSSLAARGTGATGNFVLAGSSTLAADNQITLGSGVTANSFIDKGIYFGGSNYAWKDTAGYVRGIVYGTDSNTFSSAAAVTLNSTNGTHQQITGAITAQATDSISTLNISGGYNLTLADGATLTVDGILKAGGTAAVISGGTGIRPSSGAEWVIRNDDALTITSPILANGSNALTKSGVGTLKLSGSCGLTGNIAINEGTLQLDLPSDIVLSSVLSGTGNLVKTGTGKLTLNGSASTFSGNLQINNSTVVLDMSGMGAPVNLLNPASRITLGQSSGDSVTNGIARGGATLIIKGKSSGVTTQVLSENSASKAGITVNTGTSKILVDPNGGTETQVLGGWLGNVSSNGSRNYGGALVIGQANDGTSTSHSSIAGGIVFTEDANNTNVTWNGSNMAGRILWAWNGGVAGTDMDFVTAAPTQSNNPMRIYPTGTLGSAYQPLAANSSNADQHFLLTGSLTATAGLATSGLKIANLADSNQMLNLNGLAWSPRGGILLTGDKDFLIQGGTMGNATTGGDGSVLVLQYGTGVLTISSVLNRNGNGSFTKSGPGKLVLSGANTYDTQTFFTEGVVQAGIAENAGVSGPLGKNTAVGALIFAGGTLQYSSVNQFDYSPRFGNAGGEPIKIDTNGQTVTFASGIVGTATELTQNDTATTKGKLTLTGTNTYTGPTTVSAGTLQFAKQVSLYNNQAAAPWSAANLVVKSGATAAFNVGNVTGTPATEEFTATDIQALSALGTASGGFENGSNIGLDTTNAGGGSFTYVNIIANPSGGANALGVTKLGTGELVLDAANIYTGNTTIHGGTLKLGAIGSIADSANIIVGDAGSSGAVLDVSAVTAGFTVGSAQTLSGIGSINGSTTIQGINAPGSSAGILTFNSGLAYAASSKLQWQLMDNVDTGRGTSFDGVNVTGGTFSLANLAATIDLSFGGAVSFADLFWKAAHKWTVVDLLGAVTDTGSTDIFKLGTTGGATGGSFSVTREDGGDGNKDVVLNWNVSTATPYEIWAKANITDRPSDASTDPSDDPDNDGVTNLGEFAFNGDPLDGSDRGFIFSLTADSSDAGTAKELILTVAVRKTAPFTSGTPAVPTSVDGITYTIQGSLSLSGFTQGVTTVDTIDPGVLLTDPTNYEYRSFSLDGSNGLPTKGFLRAMVEMP